MNKKAVILILLLGITIGCRQPAETSYTLNSYLNLNVDSLGNLPRNPYIVDLEKGTKHLIVIGVMHSYDTTNPVFASIAQVFAQLKPGVLINEGGVLSKKYTSRNEAIADNGELGLEKYLADLAGIKTINGDAPFKEEYQQLTQSYSEEEAILQYASERFILPCKYGNDSTDLRKVYEQDFVVKYALADGLRLSEKQRNFDYYTTAYQKYFGRPFSLADIDAGNFLALSDAHHMCEVTRKSKEIRDVYLLQQIKDQLAQHDRVLVIYGGWHVLAIEPALPQLLSLN